MLTPEIQRQIDLATPSPKDLAKALSDRMNMRSQTFTMHELFWFSLFNCLSFASSSGNEGLMKQLRDITEEMVGAHYAYHAVRLELVKPVPEEG